MLRVGQHLPRLTGPVPLAEEAAVAAAACPSVVDGGDAFSYLPSALEPSGLEGQTDVMVLFDKNPFKTLVDQEKISGAMVLLDKNPFKALMDQEKAQGLNKDQYELGMKVWLQTQMGTQRVGHLPRLTSTVPLAEEAVVAAAACPSVRDGDGVFSLMPSSLDFSGLESQTDDLVLSDKNPFKALVDREKAAVAAAACPSVLDVDGVLSYLPSTLEFSGLEGQTDDLVLSERNPFKALVDQEKAAVAAAACPSVLDGDGVLSYLPSSLEFSGLEGQTDDLALSERNPFKALVDQEKAAVAAATCPPVVDDGWTSFMFSMIRRMVSEENDRAELWATMLQLKEQALVQEAQAKLDLLSCQPRCGEEAGQGPFMESIQVISQLTYQQAQMKKLAQATQAASEDRKLLLKHLSDIETQRAATIQLQKQAEAYQKKAQLPTTSVLQSGLMQRPDVKAPEAKLVSPAASAPYQDTKVLHSEMQDAEDQNFGEDLSLKMAPDQDTKGLHSEVQDAEDQTFGEDLEMVDKASYAKAKYEEVSTKCLKNGALRTPECEVASLDAAAMPDEGEVEDEAETCSSISSCDDCVESLVRPSLTFDLPTEL
ncbi:uncharacterized protein LOC134071004 [Sardina pilchardus]|uniref:uncharacterized protein LOC134071004 n=1 Tax=Sardina pilchardus TaxID=27697 RepID=UPI002E115BA0